MVDKCLSGGERKRIELASILALRPKLAILDEPDSGIDMLSTQDIINVIQAFRRKGRLTPVVERIPVRVVREPRTALLGAAACAQHALAERGSRRRKR